jgi:hypothetical protein
MDPTAFEINGHVVTLSGAAERAMIDETLAPACRSSASAPAR